MRRRFSFSLAAGSLAAVLASSSAMADAPTAVPAADNSRGLEEIVVTARRRAEALQNVPVAVAVVNAAALEEQGIHTETDLQSAIPGLLVNTANNSNQINYVMRGESADVYSGSPPGVQPYFDEVPFPVLSSTAFYDLENVQAIKGPQGTLFGRNATGGAVLFQTATPKDQFDGYASVQYGNFDRLIAEAALDVPLVSDKLLVRFAGTVTSGGAYVRNLYDQQLVGDKEERSGRITIDARPVDNLDNLLTVQLGNTSGTSIPNTAYYAIPCGQPSGVNSCTYSPANQPFFSNLLSGKLFPGYPSGYVYPGGLQSLPAYQRSVGPYVVDQDSSLTHLATEDMVINKTTYDISSSLSIKNIFGYSYMVDALDYAPSDTPYPIVLLNSPGTLLSGASLQMETTRTKTYSDEVQLPGKAFADRLNYLFGVFYLNSNQDYYVPTWIGANDAYVHFANTAGNKSYAGFTQASYAVTDQLNVTLGGRYTREDISMVQDAQSVFGQGNPQSATESHPSWTASLDYHLTHELMVYVTTRGSWRRGGFNGLDPPTPTPETAASKPGGNYFLPEQVRDVEGGFKFDGHIGALPFRTDVAVYNSWVTDIQKSAYVVLAGNNISATVNVPKSDIKGVEADATIQPIDWLRLGASVTYTDARFTEPQSLLFGNPVVFGPFGDVPRFSGTVYADTTWNLPGDKGALNYHIDLYGQSAYWFSNLGGTIQPGTELPPYTLLNMRLDWDDMFGKGVKVSLFVKNLTNRLYYTGGAPNAQTYSLEQATFGMPRTYGIVIREKF